MRVRGRTSSGKSWKYILLAALASPFGSLTTTTPCRIATRPNSVATPAAHGRAVTSSEGTLRSMRTSRSSTVIRSFTAFLPWSSERNAAESLYFAFLTTEVARADTFSLAS